MLTPLCIECGDEPLPGKRRCGVHQALYVSAGPDRSKLRKLPGHCPECGADLNGSGEYLCGRCGRGKRLREHIYALERAAANA